MTETPNTDNEGQESTSHAHYSNKHWWHNEIIREWCMISVTAGAMFFTGWLVWQNGDLVDNAKQSLKLANETLRFQKESDSANRIIQQTKDSINTKSQNNRDSITFKQVNSSLVFARKTINIAESTNVLTMRSVDISDRNSRKELRPYIAIDSLYEFTTKTGVYVRGVIEFKNIGKTYARNFNSWGNFFTNQDSILYWVYYSKGIVQGLLENPTWGGVLISPDERVQEVFHSRNIVSTSDSIEITKNNLFFVGSIVYRDLFNDKHTMMFCWKYTKDLGWIIWSKYNDAD